MFTKVETKVNIKVLLVICRDISRQGTETVIAETQISEIRNKDKFEKGGTEIAEMTTECCNDEIQKRNETLETGENKSKQHTPVFYDYSCLKLSYVLAGSCPACH